MSKKKTARKQAAPKLEKREPKLFQSQYTMLEAGPMVGDSWREKVLDPYYCELGKQNRISHGEKHYQTELVQTFLDPAIGVIVEVEIEIIYELATDERGYILGRQP